MTSRQTPNGTPAVKSGLALIGSMRERSIASMDGLSALGSAATHLPGALARRGCAGKQLISHHERLPVLFVHGYASGASIWRPLIQTLSRAGFGHVVTIEYNSFSCDPATVCMQIVDEIYRACSTAGATGVHVVGHSLGGLLLRQVIAMLPGRPMVRTAVTIATPHRGATLARIAPGRCGPLLREATTAHVRSGRRYPTRWLAYHGEGDRVVTASSARLEGSRPSVTNITIPACGHMTICRNPALLHSVADQLVRTESTAKDQQANAAGHALAA
jgi:pimeloyl-ACP methyl ester carboxylesterase